MVLHFIIIHVHQERLVFAAITVKRKDDMQKLAVHKTTNLYQLNVKYTNDVMQSANKMLDCCKWFLGSDEMGPYSFSFVQFVTIKI